MESSISGDIDIVSVHRRTHATMLLFSASAHLHEAFPVTATQVWRRLNILVDPTQGKGLLER